MSDDSDFVELPGPASWWSENYGFAKHRWEAARDVEAAKEAFLLVMSPDQEPPS